MQNFLKIKHFMEFQVMMPLLKLLENTITSKKIVSQVFYIVELHITLKLSLELMENAVKQIISLYGKKM